MYSSRATFRFSVSVNTSERLSLLGQFSKLCEDAQIEMANQYPVALTVNKNGECIYDAWHPEVWTAALKFLKIVERDGIIKITYPKTTPGEIEELIERFDAAIVPQWENHPVPSYKSIVHIESCLGFHLPPELITFARRSLSYGSFFLSLGEDYASDSHIIEKNQFIRANGNWLEKGSPAPDYLIFITENFMSDHFWCLDIREKDLEYPIVLWSPDLKREQGNMRYMNIREFVIGQVEFYEKPQDNKYS